MGKLTYVAGMHFSRNDERIASSNDHVFMQVAALDGEEVKESFILRFKTTGFRTTCKPDSKASEGAIFTPITEEQANILRDLSGLMIQLKDEGDPLRYQSGSDNNIPKDGVDVHGEGPADAKYVYMNCMGMVLLGCAVAGIDAEKFLQHRELSARDSNTKHMIEAVYDNDAEVVARGENYNLFAEDGDVPRGFVMTEPGAPIHGPKETLDAMAKNPTLRALMDQPTAIAQERKALLPQIAAVAERKGITIPKSLRR